METYHWFAIHYKVGAIEFASHPTTKQCGGLLLVSYQPTQPSITMPAYRDNTLRLGGGEVRRLVLCGSKSKWKCVGGISMPLR